MSTKASGLRIPEELEREIAREAESEGKTWSGIAWIYSMRRSGCGASRVSSFGQGPPGDEP